jgi:hypothetical protein
VLQALLCYSTRFRTVFANHYMTREHPGAMHDAISPTVGSDRRHIGTSYWFEIA